MTPKEDAEVNRHIDEAFAGIDFSGEPRRVKYDDVFDHCEYREGDPVPEGHYIFEDGGGGLHLMRETPHEETLVGRLERLERLLGLS